MSKKRPLVFSRAGLRGLLLVSLRGATLALAEKTDPTTRELSVHGRRGMLGGNGGSWAVDPLGPQIALEREWGRASMGSTCFLNQFFIFAAYD